MPGFVQGAQGKNINGTSSVGATATFSNPNTVHNMIAVAVLWFSHTIGGPGSSNPGITVTDSNGTYVPALVETYFPGITMGVYHILDCAAGANTITAKAGYSGAIFVNAHEVAPDAGQRMFFNSWNFGKDNTGVLAMTQGNSPRFSGQNYSFLATGIDSDNEQSVPLGTALWNTRQYNPNLTPIDTLTITTGGAELFFYGALCTFDTANVGACNVNLTPSLAGGRIIFTDEAILVNYVSMVSLCNYPTANPSQGTYTGLQTVTLTQSQGKPMYYTTDGSTPTTSSTLYTVPISIGANATLFVLVHDPSNVLADTFAQFTYQIIPNPPPGSMITITWFRRTRLGGSWANGSDNPGTYTGPQTGLAVPLNEDNELYDLEILNGSVQVVRSVLGLISPSFVYTPAMQQIDFQQYVNSPLHVRVYQISAQVGRGFVADIPDVLAGTAEVSGSGADAVSINGMSIVSTPSADGQVLTYVAGNGDLEWQLPTQARHTYSKTTGSLVNGAAETGTITMVKAFLLLAVSADRACRIQLYSTAAQMSADSGRPLGVLPTGNHGVIADIYLDSGTGDAWSLSTFTVGANMESTPSASISYRITNYSGSTSTVAANITVVPIER